HVLLQFLELLPLLGGQVQPLLDGTGENLPGLRRAARTTGEPARLGRRPAGGRRQRAEHRENRKDLLHGKLLSNGSLRAGRRRRAAAVAREAGRTGREVPAGSASAAPCRVYRPSRPSAAVVPARAGP